jgi:hypothetical protein
MTERPVIAMQYRFDFPDGTDMAPIHRRVLDKGPTFDGLAGLKQKAFLVSDAAISQPNRYAPFYVWRTARGMRDFLLSDRFSVLTEALGRPEVVTWTVLRFRRFDSTRPPAYATQKTVPVPPGTALASLRENALGDTDRYVGLHSAVVALDPQRWMLTRLLLWHDLPASEAGLDLWHVPYLAT